MFLSLVFLRKIYCLGAGETDRNESPSSSKTPATSLTKVDGLCGRCINVGKFAIPFGTAFNDFSRATSNLKKSNTLSLVISEFNKLAGNSVEIKTCFARLVMRSTSDSVKLLSATFVNVVFTECSVN